MAWKNPGYRGPDIMVSLMRASNVPWQVASMRRGYLVSNAQYRERFDPRGRTDGTRVMLGEFQADGGRYLTDGNRMRGKPFQGSDYERELRNLHSQSSRATFSPFLAPNSKYVSLTSARADTSWGEGSVPASVFRFQIWRSDVWKGRHELGRDRALSAAIDAHLATLSPARLFAYYADLTPADWDRGAEFEWLALGGTRVYNVYESRDARQWAPVAEPTADGWWESLPPLKGRR